MNLYLCPFAIHLFVGVRQLKCFLGRLQNRKIANPLLPTLLAKPSLRRAHLHAGVHMSVRMSVCLLITCAKLGSSRGSTAGTTNSFWSFKSLYFHGLARLQNVLQIQRSMRELNFPLSCSTAVTKLAILYSNFVLDWRCLFYLAEV